MRSETMTDRPHTWTCFHTHPRVVSIDAARLAFGRINGYNAKQRRTLRRNNKRALAAVKGEGE